MEHRVKLTGPVINLIAYNNRDTMAANKNFLVGVFEDEDVLVQAVRSLRTNGVKIHEVFTPFPVHGLDEVLGYRRSHPQRNMAGRSSYAIRELPTLQSPWIRSYERTIQVVSRDLRE